MANPQAESEPIVSLVRAKSWGLDERQRNLDVLRGIAVLGAIAGHSGGLMFDATARSDLIWNLQSHVSSSVYLFFALSGYLIAGPFVRALMDGRPLPPMGNYASRRVSRIVPAYWLAMTVLLIAAAPAGLTVVGVVAHYLLIHSEIPGQGETVYPVAWTLGIEAVFYALVPLGALALAWRSARVTPARILIPVGGLVIITFICHVAGTNIPVLRDSPWDLNDTIVGTLWAFGPGIVVAVAEHAIRTARWRLSSRLRLHNVSLMVIAGALWLSIISIREPDSTLYTLVDFAASSILIAAAVSGAVWRSHVARALAYIGLVSYGLYLWHWVIIMVLDELFPHHIFLNLSHIGWVLAFLLVLSTSLIPATASWYWVERPVMRAVRRTGPELKRTDGRLPQ